MKKNKTLIILLIIFLSILAIGITGFMINMIYGKTNFGYFRFFNTASKELVLDEKYDLDFNKIDIKMESGDVLIKKSANNEVRVVIYGDKENTKVDTSNNDLSIEAKSELCIGFCFNTDSKVEIYLPDNYDKLIKIHNKYGDIQIDDFDKATMEINEDCGNVVIKSANKVMINNEYGDINVENVNIANVSNSAGNIEIGTVYDAKVNNKYGDINIENVLNYLDIKNNCGDIEIDKIILNKNSIITADLGSIEIGKTNEIYIDAKTDLGNVKIENNYPKSDVNLKIENNCGDIEVDN